jgi:uncharacterized membrane-anchored protein YhcB (DUF1043 family)
MSVIAIVLIAIAVCGLVAVLGLEGRRRAARKQMRRERLSSVVGGHRQEAEAHAARAAELRPEAQAHREEAARHLAEAEQLDERAERSKRFATRHGEQADERAHELEQL